MDIDLGNKGLNSAVRHKEEGKILYFTIKVHIGFCLKAQWLKLYYDVMGL